MKELYRKIPVSNVLLLIFAIVLFGFMYYLTCSANYDTQKKRIVHLENSLSIKQSVKVNDKIYDSLLIKILNDNDKNVMSASVVINNASNEVIVKSFTNSNGDLYIGGKLDYGTYSIEVNSDKYFPYLGEFAFSKFSKRNLVFHLTSYRSISGIVCDISKEPIGGAAFKIVHATLDVTVDADFVDKVFYSDRDGKFALRHLASGSYVVDVSHPKYVPHSFISKTDNTESIILREKPSIIVSVIDTDGASVGGAEITLLSEHHALTSLKKNSDINGFSVFDELPLDDFLIEVVSPFDKTIITGKASTFIKDIQTVSVVISTPRFNIRGIVIDAISREGIPGATVNYHQENEDLIMQVVTDKFGKFEILERKPGNHIIYVEEKEGYISGDYGEYEKFGAVGPTKISYSHDKDIEDLIIELKPCWSISGTIYDSKGKNLEDAQVSLYLDFNPKGSVGYRGSNPIGKSLLTGEDGSYELYGGFELFNSSSSVFVRANHYKYGGIRSDRFVLKPGESLKNVDLFYKNEWNVYGKVKDDKGIGIANAKVTFVQKLPNNINRTVGIATTNENGEYAAYVKYGICFAFAKHDDYKDFERNKRIIDVKQGSKHDIDIVMTPFQTGIEGKVTDFDGNGLANAKLYTYTRNRSDDPEQSVDFHKYYGTTSVDGTFKIQSQIMENCIDGAVYDITVKPIGDYKSASVFGVDIDEKDVVIVAEEGDDQSFEIYGKVLDQNNLPVRDFMLAIVENISIKNSGQRLRYENNNQGWMLFHSISGEFKLSFENLPERDLILSAYNNELGLAYSKPISVISKVVKRDVVIQYEGKCDIHGRLVSTEDETPIEGANVSLLISSSVFNDLDVLQSFGFNMRLHRGIGMGVQSWQKHYLPKSISSNDGSFVLSKVPLGVYWLTFISKGYKTTFMRFNPEYKTEKYDVGVLKLPLPSMRNQKDYNKILY